MKKLMKKKETFDENQNQDTVLNNENQKGNTKEDTIEDLHQF